MRSLEPGWIGLDRGDELQCYFTARTLGNGNSPVGQNARTKLAPARAGRRWLRLPVLYKLFIYKGFMSLAGLGPRLAVSSSDRVGAARIERDNRRRRLE